MADPFLNLRQIATPKGNPQTGGVLLYFKSDGKLYTKNAAGVETPVETALGDVTLSGVQTLANKTISADNNTLSGLAVSSFVLSNASGNIDGSAAQKVIPSGAVVGDTDVQTLTNKTLTNPKITQAINSTTSITTNSAAFSALTTLATSPAITFDGVTEVEVAFSWFAFTKTISTDTVNVTLADGATTLMTYRLPTIADSGGGYIRVRLTPSAGVHTFTAQGQRVVGTGTVTLNGAAAYPAQLTTVRT